MKNIAIIGLGLIGGSMALSLKSIGKYNIIGVDNNSDHIDIASSLNLVDSIMDLNNAVRKADLIILAIPVNSIVKQLPIVLDKIEESQVVVDVGSTKHDIIEAVKWHPLRGRFVASHPMAGTEFSGPNAAIDGLFKGSINVICNKDESDKDALTIVEELFKDLEMQQIYMDSMSHDTHAAYVSHISHISSFALALTVLEKEKDEDKIFQLAAGGFSSTVRLAKSSPQTWTPIFEQNRDNVLDVLDEHINTLSKFRTLLIKKDFNKINELIAGANGIKKILGS